MSDHLHRALDDLVDGVATAHRDLPDAGLPLADLIARTRRGRTRRAALTTAAATCAVLALTGGTLALLPDQAPAPAPPAHTTTPAPRPSTTPAPRPSTAPTADDPAAPTTTLPTGDPGLPFGACGSLVTTPPADPVDDRWETVLAVLAEVVRPGEPVPVVTRTSLALTPDWEPRSAHFGLYEDRGPDLLVVHDGIVVAATDSYGGTWPVITAYDVEASTTSSVYRTHVPLTSCLDGGDLPAGEYQVVAAARVMPLGPDPSAIGDGTTAAAAALAAEHPQDWRRVLSEPATVTIAADGAVTTPAPPSEDVRLAAEPACGAAVPDLTTGGAFDLDAAPVASVVAGQELDAPATLTYRGPSRLRAYLRTGVQYWLEQDGVVVGTSRPASADLWASVDLDTGSVLPVPDRTDLERCDATGSATEEALPPGTYTVHPVVPVTAAELRTPEGVTPLAVPEGPVVVVAGEPFEIVIR